MGLQGSYKSKNAAYQAQIELPQDLLTRGFPQVSAGCFFGSVQSSPKDAMELPVAPESLPKGFPSSLHASSFSLLAVGERT